MLFASALQVPLSHAADNEKRVLVLFSYHPSFVTTDRLLNGIREGIGDGVAIDIEFMDSKRHFDTAFIQGYGDLLKYKLSQREKYDAVLVSDDNAFNFAVKNKQNLFPEIPMVFLAVNNRTRAVAMDETPDVTGVVEAVSIEKNIELALKLWPGTRRVIAVADGTASGKSDLAFLHKATQKFPQLKVETILINNMTWADLGERLRSLTDGDIIIRLAAYRDSQDVVLTHEEVISIFLENVTVPMLALREQDVFKGAFGGHVLSYFEQGRQAGLMVRAIFQGTPVNSIKVLRESPNQYMFDFEQLEIFAIVESDLPGNSVILNKPLSIFVTHAREIWLTIGFIVLLLLLILFLVFQIYARTRVEKELRGYRGHLEEMVATRTEEVVLAKEEAERANLAKSEFLSRMSHELRTPLNAILGFSQILESDPKNPLTEVQYKSVQEILGAGSHLLELINEVLDLARIEAGKVTVSIEPTPLLDLIQECIILIKPLSATHGIHIEEVGQDCNHTVWADRTRLKQVLLNLFSNAVKYNSEQGTVSISCVTTGPYAQIRVTDTGKGLSPEQQNLLFTPFERLDSDNSAIEGTGIGLALSQNLVRLMQGEIGVDSEQGVGSTFWVKLSISVGDGSQGDDAGPRRGSLAASTTTQERWTVLCIEDNPVNMRLMQQIFTQRPDIGILFEDMGAPGLELAQSQRPDLIILDINLPDMDGFEVMKCLRTNELTRGIPVVAVSANIMPRDIARGKAAGFVKYLTKPLNVSALLEVVDQITEKLSASESPSKD